jgi:alginate O-acetyltransferase complex protein AlgI
VSSLFFYGWWDWRFVGLLIVTVLIGYWTGQRVHASRGSARARHFLTASIVVQLGLLGFFKYFNFFAASATDLLQALGMQADWVTLKIVLPVGISFYTFHTMSYTIDIYRGKLEPEPSFLKFAEFVTTWPVLVAGPIIRASALLPQLNLERHFTWENFVRGLELVLAGYCLKCGVADNLATYVDQVYGNPDTVNGLTSVIGTLFFAFQIYGDFAGYSLIAIGMGRIMGVDFGRNFERPYFATSFSDFWRRWHISLSSWLRDYLYISLGGNRYGRRRTHFNLMATMLLGGLWHGANWTFVIWGALHGFYQILQRETEPSLSAITQRLRVPAPVSKLIAGLVVFTLVCVAWMFFRAPDVETAVRILGHLFVTDYAIAGVPAMFQVFKGFFLIAVLLAAESVLHSARGHDFVLQHRWVRFTTALLAIWMLALAGNFSGHQFIYFAF